MKFLKAIHSIPALAFLAFGHLTASHLHGARVLHVDATKGSDVADGLSPNSAFRSIQHAASMVIPGDEVVIHPGVYFGGVIVKKGGQAKAPIRFRADEIAKNRVVISGADPSIRGRKTAWNLVDEKLGLYSVTYDGAPPNRVLYSGTDLYPYASLEQLKSFTTEFARGPRHGYFHDAATKMLHVRLHASGQYGSTDPAAHAMAVGVKDGYGFTLLGNRPGYITLEGITFETPGDAAVYTEASCVTVRDCWFLGTPYGVRGTNKGRAQHPDAGPYDTASEVVIEHCEYTEGSPFNDVTELLRARQAESPGQRAEWTDIWHRKTTGKYGLPADKKNYENGIAVRMGRGWRIRHNHIHDCFEGLANDGMDLSVDTWIHNNVFARICDNAVETENHARDVRIFKNVFQDVLEPVSWQPLGGPPWPGPVWFYQNVVVNTPDMAALWGLSPHEARGVFKMGISQKNWHDGKSTGVAKDDLAAPMPGLLFFNNSIYFPGGRLLTLLGNRDVPIRNVIFANNLIAVDAIASRSPETDLKAGHFQFFNNRVASTSTDFGAAAKIAADEGGSVVPDVGALGWVDPTKQDFHLKPGTTNASPGMKMSGDEASLPVAGALQPGEAWTSAHVGPRIIMNP